MHQGEREICQSAKLTMMMPCNLSRAWLQKPNPIAMIAAQKQSLSEVQPVHASILTLSLSHAVSLSLTSWGNGTLSLRHALICRCLSITLSSIVTQTSPQATLSFNHAFMTRCHSSTMLCIFTQSFASRYLAVMPRRHSVINSLHSGDLSLSRAASP